MKKLRDYFENNLISYTYLFFAATTAVAYKGYFTYTASSKLPQYIVNSYFGVAWTLLSPLLFPILFLVASLVTFKAPYRTFNKITVYTMHFLLCVFIIIYSVIG